MAVIYPFREVYAESASSLTITPPAGRAIRVKRVEVEASSKGWATLKSGLVSVGYFEIGTSVRNHLYPNWLAEQKYNLFDILKDRGIPLAYPVVEGDSFVVSCDVTADRIRAIYEEVEAGDVTGEEPNGKRAKKRFVVYYGTNENRIESTGWSVINKSLMPPEFRGFPFEEAIPVGYRVQLYGLCFLEQQANRYDGTNDLYATTKRVRIKINRELVWHPEEDGFLCEGGGASAGSVNVAYGQGDNVLRYADWTAPKLPFFFDEPFELKAGDEMTIEVYCEVDSGSYIEAEDLRMALICKLIQEG